MQALENDIIIEQSHSQKFLLGFFKENVNLILQPIKVQEQPRVYMCAFPTQIKFESAFLHNYICP